MKNFSVKTIVAIGIGAALFFVLGRFVAIPSPVPNVNISTQYGLLAFMSIVYGPVAGTLIGFIGHALIDFSFGWGVWWSWVIASAVFGLLVGFAAKLLKLDHKIGSILPGRDANLVVVDEKFNVQEVYFRGELVTEKEVY